MICLDGSVVEVSALSKETIGGQVEAIDDGAAVDLSATTVRLAVAAVGSAPSSWVAGAWDTDTATDPDTYRAEVQIGPGSTLGALAVGDYHVWVEVTSAPDVMVDRLDGVLRIY